MAALASPRLLLPASRPSHGRFPHHLQPSFISAHCPNNSLSFKLHHQPRFTPSSASSFEPCESWKSWVSAEDWVDTNSAQIDHHLGFFSSESTTAQHPPSQFLWARGKWALLLVYRALLIGGIGLSFSAPVLADPVASEVPVVSTESNVQDQEKARKSEARASDTAVPENFEALSDEFWDGLDTSERPVEHLLKVYLKSNPTNVRALECLAHVLMDTDDMPRALIVLEKLQQLEPDEVEWKYMKAQAYECTGEFEVARQRFEELLKLEPFSSRALQGLALAMDQAGETGAALELLESSMARARQENKVLEARNLRMLIGQFHTLKGRLKVALQHYKDMIDEDPEDFRPYLCQGIIYSVLGEKNVAEQQFNKYQELCPKDFPNRKYLDKLMSRAKNEGEKIHDLNQKPPKNGAEENKKETSKQS